MKKHIVETILFSNSSITRFAIEEEIGGPVAVTKIGILFVGIDLLNINLHLTSKYIKILDESCLVKRTINQIKYVNDMFTQFYLDHYVYVIRCSLFKNTS